MKTYKTECIQEIANNLLSVLEKEGLSKQTLKDYKTGFSLFRRYVTRNHIDEVDEKVCLDYIESKTGIRKRDFPAILLIGKLRCSFVRKAIQMNITVTFQVLLKESLAAPLLETERKGEQILSCSFPAKDRNTQTGSGRNTWILT